MKYIKLFEDLQNIEELKKQIKEYLNQEYTREWFNNEFSNRAHDYIEEEEAIEYGTEDDPDYEEAYKNLCTGNAIEYDLLTEIGKDICNKFDIDEDEYYYNTELSEIANEHLKDKASDWCDPYFGKSINDIFLGGQDKLMKNWDNITDDGNGIKL